MIWQRVPMGSGDVKKKRAAFEQQIKALSVGDTEQMRQNGSSAAHKVARQIMDEEAANTSPGMARSPAMHQGCHCDQTPASRVALDYFKKSFPNLCTTRSED